MKNIISFFCLIILLAVFPLLVIYNSKEPIFNAILLLPLATVIFVTIKIINIINKKNPQYMRLFFWIFIYIMFGIAPIAQLIYGFYLLIPKPNAYTTERIIYCYMLIWLGLAAYEIGYSRQQKRQKKLNWPVKDTTNSDKTKNGKDFIFALLVLLIAGTALIYLSSQSIKFFIYKEDFSKQIIEKFGTVGSAFIYLTVSFLPLYAILLGIIDLRNNQFNLFFKLIYYFVVLSLCALLIITSNPLSSPRWWLGTISISFFLLFFGKKIYTPALLSIVIPFIYIFVFYYLAIFRSEYSFRLIPRRDFSIIANLKHGDFDSLQQIINTLVYVKYEGLTYGRQLLGVIGFWIPRYLWPQKPLNTGELIGMTFNYSNINLSAPLWAEGFINFSVFGSALFLFVWGIISGKLDFIYGNQLSKIRNINRNDVKILVLAGSQHLLLRGSLLVSTLYILPPILIIGIWFFVGRVFKQIKIQRNKIF